MIDALLDNPRSPIGARQRLTMTTQWPEFDLAVITVTGHVDAGNAATLLDYTLGKALLCRRMELDLCHLDYLGCDGYLALKTLECRAILADVELTMLTGPEVARTLRVCELAAQHSALTHL